MKQNKTVAIIGTVGVPANYGGFETLVENLLRYHQKQALQSELTVYCSSKAYSEQLPSYCGAKLRYVPLNANGVQSIVYDMVCMVKAVVKRSDTILLLGVSGAILLPLIRLFSRARIVTNIDGIEWRRDKWNRFAKWFLKLSERFAVKYSHDVVADNQAIADYVEHEYRRSAHVIAYGGDHALEIPPSELNEYALPASYAFGVCRIEPENNIAMVVDAFSKQTALPLVMVGNWDASEYGKGLRKAYAGFSQLMLLDPIYDLGKLNTLRSNTALYVHGHSAGGTNPSLVEAMHFAKPIAAFDCSFNRYTTEDRALFFSSSDDLLAVASEQGDSGAALKEVADRRYTWDVVAAQYFELM